MLPSDRRYDIDWIRVIAIGLLVIYHTAIGFQPWGIMIGFITNDQPWAALWTPMAMLNVWRIPLLFFVSGMGVYFAIQRRNWKQFLLERTQRILVPFMFGAFCIVPVHLYIWRNYNQMEQAYTPGPGHLWFLGNIFLYVLIFIPLCFYLKNNQSGRFVLGLKRLMSTPLGLLPVFAAFVAEALIIDPHPYEYYAMTWHGFFLGMLGFVSGFLFVLSGDTFLNMIVKWRWMFLSFSVGLFVVRMYEAQINAPVMSFQLPVESISWILSILAFGNRYLNHTGKMLKYLSPAAYPIYILHMIFLYLGSALIFPLEISVQIKYVLVLAFTFAGCFSMYEVIKRVKALRFLFGIKGQ